MVEAGKLAGGLARLGAVLCGIVLFALVGLFYLVQSQTGLSLVSEQAAKALSDTKTTVRVSGLKGSLMSSFTIESVTVADRLGVYAEISNARITWKPSSLFERLVELKTVSAGKITLSRLPETENGSKPESPASTSLGFDIKAPEIEISEIALAPAVLGETQRLTASASVSVDRTVSHALLALSLKRIDGGLGEADISLDYAAKPARFKTRIRVFEPEGGLLSHLARLPRGDKLKIDVSGTGPPDNWHGNISVEAGRDTTLNSAVTLELRNSGIGIVLDGSATPGSLIPDEVGRIVGPRIELKVDAEYTRNEGLKIGRFSAESRHVMLSGTGHYDPAADKITVSTTGSLHDDPPIGSLLTGTSVRRLGFELKLDGPIEALNGALSFQANSFTADAVNIPSGSGTITLRAAPDRTFDLKATANADGLELSNAVPAGLVGPGLNVEMSGRLSRTGSLSDMTLAARSGPLTTTLSGRVDKSGQGRGQYKLNLAQMEELTRSFGFAVKGKLGAAGPFQANLGTGEISASVDGALENLETPSAELDEILGERVSISGQISQTATGNLVFKAVKIASEIGQLDADGFIDTATSNLSSDLTFAIPELGSLKKLIGKPLAGKVSLTANLSGPLVDLSVKGTAKADDVTIDNLEIGNLTAAYDTQIVGTKVRSSVQLNGLLEGKSVEGTLDGIFDKNSISLSNIDIAVGKNKVAGKLDLDMTRLNPSGAIKLTVNDIRDLPGGDQLALSGSGTLDLKTVNDGAITMAADFLDIRVGTGAANTVAIGKAAAQFKFNQPFDNPAATGSIDLENFQAAGLRRGKAKIAIDGTPSKLGWSIVANASSSYPVSLSANGDLALAADRSHVELKKLDGKIESQAFSLSAPFTASWQTNAWQIAPVGLTFAGGELQVSGALKGGVLDAEAQFDNMPLSLLSLVSTDMQMDGNVAGKLRVAGNPLKPEIAISMDGANIRPPDVPTDRFPGFDISLNVIQNAKDTVATGTVTGAEDTTAAFTFKSRPLIRLSPVSLDVESETPISGDAKASGRLDLIDRIVGLGNDRITGRIDATVELSGTFEHPVVKGKAELIKGTYEGTATGTTLRNIEAKAVLSGDRLEMESLTANDGGDGRLSGSGAVRFSKGGASSNGISIRLDQFTALRHPLAEAVVTGDMSLSGSLDDPLLTAKLTIVKGDIQIPEKLPPQIVELDVVEINGRTVDIPETADKKDPSLSASFPVTLDLFFTAPNRTFVRGRGLNSEWKGDIHVAGTSDAPIIKGKLEAIRGTFAFAGKTFVVERGTVTFPTEATEPDIDVAAEAKLKDLIARVEISGSLTKPSISISSEPSLPQEDVLAQILFGRTTGQLSPIQAAQLAQTAATLSGKGGPGIVDKVRQTLGVDVLNVESDESGGTGASLKAGKYLTEDIFLSVTQGTKAGSQKIGVEVQVLPNITVESDVSGNADSNIGIKWKWDY